MPTFYMLVGLPASGKTTKAKWMEENCPCTEKVVAISSDALREKLLGDAGDQSRNSEIFDVLHSLVKAHLYYGNSPVFDATNLGSRYRKQFLKSLELIPCKKVCIYMKTPYEVCLERNQNRERTVPFGVMRKMKRFLDEPTLDEGWDEVYIEEESGWQRLTI